MILYTKKGRFLGMGLKEITLLGFDEMEEFTHHHHDIADFFVPKQGYISKFPTFSWLEYALQSAQSLRKVIVRTKQGKMMEREVRIVELFLVGKLDGEMACYGVELLPISTQEEEPEETTIPPSQYRSIDEIDPKEIDTLF